MSSATLIEKCGLIAQSVAGDPTHFVVEQAFTQAGLDWRFMSFEVSPNQLGDAMRGIRALGFRGVKIAEPYQEAVREYLDELTDRARLCGSVNCVTADGVKLVGDNTEGAALVELVRGVADPAGQKAMIIGAGRIARALAMALAQAGASEIAIASRSAETGQRLVDLVSKETSARATLVEFGPRTPIRIGGDLKFLVNATSLSTVNPSASLPIEVSPSASPGVVVDVSYSAPSTWLTREARKRGCRIIDGIDLYVRQTALALKNWTGSLPDMAAMREAAEEFLGI